MQNTDTTIPQPIEVASATHIGEIRTLNEDSVWAAALEQGANNPWQLSALLVIADGMGGHDAGEVASALAVEKVREIFASEQPGLAPENLHGEPWRHHVNEAVLYINRMVYAAGEGNGAARPGTTLTVCLARPTEFMVGHVGDSRAYLIRRNSVEQVTEDHSMVAEAVRRGHMSEEEARTSQFRNQITQAVGLRAEVQPHVSYRNWETGDVVLLCSDGLTEYVLPDEMLRQVQSGDSLKQVCDALIRMANERGGHDNISVAAARFLSPLGAHAEQAGARKPATWPPTTVPATAAATVPARQAPVEQLDPEKTKSDVAPAPSRTGSKMMMPLAIVGGIAVLAGAGWLIANKNKPKAGSKTPGIITVQPPGMGGSQNSAASNQASHESTPPVDAPQMPSLKIYTDPGQPVITGLLLTCPGFKFADIRRGGSRNNGKSHDTTEKPLQGTTGYKSYIAFKAPEPTDEELIAGGYFQVYQETKARVRVGDRLTKNATVKLKMGEKQYSIFLVLKDGTPRDTPIVTFRLKAIKGDSRDDLPR